MRKKNIIITLVILILLAVIGAAVYYFFFYKKPGMEQQTPQQQTGQFPAQENVAVIEEKLARISAVEAVSPVASADGTKIVYLGKKEGVYESAFDGANLQETRFAPQQNLVKAVWSPDRNGIIATYANADGRKFFYYDLTQKTATPFAADVRWVSSAKKENEVAYHRLDEVGGTNAVVVANLDGTDAQTVFTTRLKDVRLEFAASDNIAIWTAPSGLAENTLWSLDPATRKLSAVLTNISGMTPRWSPDGETLLYSQTAGNGKQLTLFAAQKNGANAQRLGVATLPEKCAFANDAVSAVCAAPKDAPDIVWPDDYYKKIYAATEQLWQVNFKTGSKNMLFEFPSASFDATDLILSPDGSTLVFVNRKDSYLYSVKLK